MLEGVVAGAVAGVARLHEEYIPTDRNSISCDHVRRIAFQLLGNSTAEGNRRWSHDVATYPANSKGMRIDRDGA